MALRLLRGREKLGHELVEGRIDVQVDADQSDHLLVAVADGDGTRLHQRTGPAAREVTLGVILAGALDVLEHTQGQIGDRRPQGTSRVKAVCYLDH
ncbi:hypothetical protein D3C79_347770 [compost metagenome]